MSRCIKDFSLLFGILLRHNTYFALKAILDSLPFEETPGPPVPGLSLGAML